MERPVRKDLRSNILLIHGYRGIHVDHGYRGVREQSSARLHTIVHIERMRLMELHKQKGPGLLPGLSINPELILRDQDFVGDDALVDREPFDLARHVADLVEFQIARGAL